MEQSNQVRKIARSELMKAGFEVMQPQTPSLALVGPKLDRDCIHLSAVRVGQRISKTELADPVNWAVVFWVIEIREHLDYERIEKLRRATECLVFCTLGRGPRALASAALPSFSVESNLGAYLDIGFLRLALRKSVGSNVRVHVIDRIESGDELKAELRKKLTPAKVHYGSTLIARQQRPLSSRIS
jgi:hypothetical protein